MVSLNNGLSGSFDRFSGDTQGKKNNLLYATIGARDVGRAEKALTDGADPNADDAKPLRMAANNDDYLMAKMLILKGDADIGYALMRARQENEAIPRKTESGMVMSWRIPLTENGKQREIALGKEIAKLETFQKTFNESTLPMEQMNLLRDISQQQRDLARRLDRVEKSIRDITEPQMIEKKTPTLTHPRKP